MKKWTTAELFNVIMDTIEEKGLKPDIIDYALATRDEVEITSSCISIKNNLDWGGNEGIYLDLSLQIFDDWTDKMELVPFGTIKTLGESAEAMRTMGILLANIICETSEYIRNNSDEFTWTGVKVSASTEEQKKQVVINCRNMDIAKKEAQKLLLKYPIVKIRDNETHKEQVLENHIEEFLKIELDMVEEDCDYKKELEKALKNCRSGKNLFISLFDSYGGEVTLLSATKDILEVYVDAEKVLPCYSCQTVISGINKIGHGDIASIYFE